MTKGEIFVADQTVLWIWLAEVFGTGSIRTDEIIDVFGSAEAVYEASPEDYRKLRYLTKSDYGKLCDKSLDEAERIFSYCADKNYHLIPLDSPSYPGKLRDIPSRPIMLYADGTLPDVDLTPSFSIVGTRKATPYGAKVASMMAMGVAQAGGIVTSGMAEGIDTFAHKGALRGNGKTIAVLGCGLDICYPRSNLELRENIRGSGCVLSEHPPKTRPTQYAFPIRNRIISGLSEVTVVVEAGIKSGSLITATSAAEQGRTVYAVPGNVDRSESAGPNRLIIDGARPLVTVRQLIAETLPLYPHVLRLAALENTSLLETATQAESELLEEIKTNQKHIHTKKAPEPVQSTLTGMETETVKKPLSAPEGLNELQMQIYRVVSEGNPNLNEIAAACSAPVYKVLAEVTALELKKVIELLPTGRFIIKD